MRAEHRFWLILLAAILLAGLTARLGFWQMDRARTKLSLQAEREAAGQLPPLSLADLAQAKEHRRFRLSGRWLEPAQLWLGNRPHDGQVGFILLTPLELADGSLLWVQRGWHPRASTGYQAPPWPPSPPNLVTVEGRLARHASRAFELGQPEAGAVRQNLDLAQPVRPGAPVQAWVLWQTSECKPLRCDWPPMDLGVAKHHGYAFQWFALSFLTLGLYVWFQILTSRRASARSAA